MNLMLPSDYEFLPRFFRLAITNIISNIMTPLAGLISISFLGHLDEIHDLTGVALATNLLNSLYFILSFLRMGTTGVTAQAVGRNDPEALLLVVLRNNLIALTLGLALLLFQYPLAELGFGLLNVVPEVKASSLAYFYTQIWAAPAVLLNFVLMGWFLGQEKNGLVVLFAVVGNLAKIALDYLLIFQWEWASTGAGLSYAISQYLTLLLGLIFFCLELNWQEVKSVVSKIWEFSAIRSTLTLNANIFLSNCCLIFAVLIFNYQGVGMGSNNYTENALLLQIFILCGYFVEGLGFATEALVGNSKGKGASQQLIPLASVSVETALLVALSFGGVCWLFPQTVFGFLTDHKELTEHINIYIPWLVLVLLCSSLAWILDGYFLGLAQGHTLRNASLAAFILGFVPTIFVAYNFQSNHILWLALSLFFAIRMMGLGLKLPSSFTIDGEDDLVSLGSVGAKSLEQ
ncbi:MATE family efflux transporter [Dolichospermum sp. LEGE 00240]|uniref:guanitoxin biosynthesis MATE family efflux transporter GntT n=1 Tax=Dolichospermum sp. LEGE 00240 TaxID=1828603 RepID=UPI00188239D6|nr:guanitoxin biosynthesis MATE family efflux transporter GntT [Dolichospermum sp. LEGE 00240]MBE9248415.1 MATE family efflux transporter [Dolichospermum sp. LEGE 00240]